MPIARCGDDKFLLGIFDNAFKTLFGRISIEVEVAGYSELHIKLPQSLILIADEGKNELSLFWRAGNDNSIEVHIIPPNAIVVRALLLLDFEILFDRILAEDSFVLFIVDCLVVLVEDLNCDLSEFDLDHEFGNFADIYSENFGFVLLEVVVDELILWDGNFDPLGWDYDRTVGQFAAGYLYQVCYVGGGLLGDMLHSDVIDSCGIVEHCFFGILHDCTDVPIFVFFDLNQELSNFVETQYSEILQDLIFVDEEFIFTDSKIDVLEDSPPQGGNMKVVWRNLNRVGARLDSV